MAKQSFPYTSFMTADGSPLSNGHITLGISNDASVSGSQICGGIRCRLPLDANGNLTPVPQVWPNDQMYPAGTFYLLSTYTSSGELVLSNFPVSIAS